MKKILILIVLQIATVSLSFSQINNFGLYFSPDVNFRKLDKQSSYLDKYDEKVNLFNFGLSYEKYLTMRLSLLTGLDYSIDGFNRKPVFLINSYAYTTKYRLNYVGIPVELNYYILSTSRLKFGLHLGFNIKSLVFAKYVPVDIQKDQSSNYYDPFNYPFSDPYPETKKYSWNDLNSLDYNVFNVDFLGGIRICFLIKNISIGVSPEIKLSLLSTRKQRTYFHTDNERLYSYGLKFMISKN